LNGRTPLILQGVMDNWPALTKWKDGSFFASGPWASHQINLTQHSALDVCLQQIQIAIEVDWKHELDQVEDYPKAGFTLLGEEEAVCSRLMAALDRVEASRAPDQSALIRSLVLNNTAPNRQVITTIGAVASQFSSDQGQDASQHGSYLFLESRLFSEHPRLWQEYITPVPDILDPMDFTPQSHGDRSGRRSLLIGRKGSRTSLHMDPYGETSWIAVISGKKAFRLWPENATQSLYPNDGYKSGVKHTMLDSFNTIPTQAVNYHHGPKPLEVVLYPGEVILTMDWWHQAYNLEDGVAVTGNFIDAGNVEKVLKRAWASGSSATAKSIMSILDQKDPELYKSMAARGAFGDAL